MPLLLPVFILGCLAAEIFTSLRPSGLISFSQNPTLNVTVGFALPPQWERGHVDEALVVGISFALRSFDSSGPHEDFLESSWAKKMRWSSGSWQCQWQSGMPLGYSSAVIVIHSEFRLFFYVDFISAEEAQSTPFSIDFCRAEVATLGSNNTLIPLLNEQVNATFSPLSTWGTDAAQFIFRCQNCSIITKYFQKTIEANFTTVISTSYPEYIDNTLTLANLSLVGAQSQEVTLNTTAAHFSNYSAILSAAGFD
ncbi:hypothetical protein DFH07DRAFT_784911 [Mycena maculata]|uniref:Uncharacterized protein n=1 Tax=Mycena maculata TaxID=230809 RepID=A0AAD7HE15_9AGAR|nr:hypothetical protein DFH07DRAFT_784911 [Mycena maculata]